MFVKIYSLLNSNVTIALATIACCTSAAFAQTGHEGMQMGTKPESTAVAKTPFMSETMAGMTKMHNDMMDPSKLNGVPDHDFMIMMIPHHKGAVAMAETLLKYGKDEKLKDLARGIIKEQKKEIAQMEKWIQKGVGSKK